MDTSGYRHNVSESTGSFAPVVGLNLEFLRVLWNLWSDTAIPIWLYEFRANTTLRKCCVMICVTRFRFGPQVSALTKHQREQLCYLEGLQSTNERRGWDAFEIHLIRIKISSSR